MLETIPNEAEIKEVVFGLNLDSTPGPDGFGGAFYQSCWDTIRSNLIDVIQQFFGGTGLTKFYTSSCFIILPKTDNPNSFNDMRHISLSNCSNKIISKILSSRLNNILPNIISENQSAFLKGRSITKNVLLAQEIINDIRKNNFGRNTIIKLDMAKAYDPVNWNFLLHALKKFGFSDKWVDMIRRLISNVWYSVIINGVRRGFFPSTRGLKQVILYHLLYLF